MRGGIEGGDGAGGTPANPNARGVDVVGGGVLAEPANGFGGVLGGGIEGSIEGAGIRGGAGFKGGVIAYEPVFDGGADVTALGEGFAKVKDCNGSFTPSDECTTMNNDHDGALFGEVYSSGFVNIQAEINGTAGGIAGRTGAILDALSSSAAVDLIDEHNAGVSGKGGER